jgi:hypothetical protein
MLGCPRPRLRTCGRRRLTWNKRVPLPECHALLLASFTSITLPALDAGLAWDTTSLSTDGTLRLVHEPGTGLALLVGAGTLLGIRRRRSRSRLASLFQGRLLHARSRLSPVWDRLSLTPNTARVLTRQSERSIESRLQLCLRIFDYGPYSPIHSRRHGLRLRHPSSRFTLDLRVR